MRNRDYGLVAAGGVSQSFLTRLPGFLVNLGPIKAPSYHTSRRIANSMRHGYAALHYSVLETCAMLWIAVPETALEQTLRDLVAQTPIRRTKVVLVGVRRDSLTPGPLQATGARVATLNAVEGTGERSFVAEGHPDTVRELRRLFQREKKKLIELLPATKPSYFAGVQFATNFLWPSISTAAEAFRLAGFRQADALAIAGTLGEQAVHLYSKAGRKAWNPKVARELLYALKHETEPLTSLNPGLAEAFVAGIRSTLIHFEKRGMKVVAQ